MDIQDDCVIEEVTPLKTKKLKQARLQFQTLNTSESSVNVSTKKRKLESPGECKTRKIVKTTNTERVVQDSEVKSQDSNVNKNLDSDGSNVDTDEEIKSDKSENLNEAKRNNIGKEKEEVDELSKQDEAERNKVGKKTKEVDKLSQQAETERSEVEEEEEKETDILLNPDENNRNSVKSKKLVLPKTKKKEPHSTNTSLRMFFKKSDKKKREEKNVDDSIEEYKGEKELKPCDVSLMEDENETSDTDSNKMDDDILEIKMDAQKQSSVNDTMQKNKISLCSNFDSETAVLSSDNEDNNANETTDMEIMDINESSPKTPKQTSLENASILKGKKVTPKILQKQMESAKKREEKEKLRMEREKKREEERENRRKEKEAEKEQKRKEKELKKQSEIEQKQKEKEAKEQERRKREEAKEEEKKKKEEEKLELERKKQKAASNFASFFFAKKPDVKSPDEENNMDVQTFMPFEIKADMRVAPITRRSLQEHEKLSLDEKCNGSEGVDKKDLYLGEVKEKRGVIRKSGPTWPFEAKDDVIVLEEEENEDNASVVVQVPTVTDKNRAKLLQFHENRRPPYWGTWRKRSKTINPRRPFYKDSTWFDYEVDSDDEWEEEEPGESLRGSEDEKDEENPDDDEYDVDNEFMVPHGYLSDEEARADEEENENMTAETQKFKLKILGEQFEAERNEKTLRLKPKIIGCVWLGPDNTYPENTPKRVVDFLTARHAWVSQIPIVLPSQASEATDAECHTPTAGRGSMRKTKVSAEALPDLIRLIHGNTHGRKFLVREFLTYWCKQHQVKENQISKTSLQQKISEIGKWMPCPDEGQMHLKACWYVSEEIRKEYLSDEELPLPNRWTYNLTPKRKSEIIDSNDKIEKQEKEKLKKTVPLITQFTKRITQEEMTHQLSTQSTKNEAPKNILQRPPKRAVLITLPRTEHKAAPITNTDQPENKKPNNDSGDK